MRSAFDEYGYASIDTVPDAERCEAVSNRVSAASLGRAGSRNLLHDACCADLALCLKSFAAFAEHLPATAVAVQCMLFDRPRLGTGSWPCTTTLVSLYPRASHIPIA